MSTVLVCGGRNYADQKRAYAVLDSIAQYGMTIESIVEGGATGADLLARRWAHDRGVRVVTVRANWIKYGRRAGPIRNTHMLSTYFPDLVVAFPGGNGTKDMVSKATKAGVEVLIVAAADSAENSKVTAGSVQLERTPE